MRTCRRATALALATASLTIGLAGCGKTGQPSGPSGPATGKGSMKMANEEVRKIEISYPTAFASAAKAGGSEEASCRERV